MCGSLTTKELKKKHSFTGSGAEMGSQGREDTQQDGDWRTGWFYICLQIEWEEELGSRTECSTQGPSVGK